MKHIQGYLHLLLVQFDKRKDKKNNSTNLTTKTTALHHFSSVSKLAFVQDVAV